MIQRVTVGLLLLVLALAFESPYLGKITLAPLTSGTQSRQYIYFTPLSQQPKIANIKHRQIELVHLNELSTCLPLPSVIPIDPQDPQNPKEPPPIFAIIDLTKLQRLACGMMVKIRNVKQAGYKGFILVMETEHFLKNHCRMYDDNSFFTGVMEPTQYEKLTNYQQKGVDSSQDFKTMGLISIELKDTSAKLIEVWVSSFNPKSYQTLTMLSKAFKELPSLDQEHVKWTPRFATLACSRGDSARSCSTNGYISSCACKGEFCSPEIRDDTPFPMVQEDIRQLLIYKQYGTKFLTYAESFANDCLQKYQNEKQVQGCATNLMDKLGLDSFSINSVIGTFLDHCTNEEDEEEQIKESDIYSTLERDQRAFASYGRYPLVLVNKQIVNSDNQDNFNAQLCNKLNLEDSSCEMYVNIVNQKSSVVSIIFFILLGLALVGGAAAVIYFYRRKLKRDVNKEIKMQVSTAVEHYFALTETTNNK